MCYVVIMSKELINALDTFEKLSRMDQRTLVRVTGGYDMLSFDLDQIGCKIVVTEKKGYENIRWTTITGDSYQIYYTRTWPDYNATGAARLAGHIKHACYGDKEEFMQHLTFLQLASLD